MSTTNSSGNKNSSSKKTVARTSEAPAKRVRRASAPAVEIAALDDHQVAALAYQFYVESGYQQGHALEHWLRAETELRAR